MQIGRSLVKTLNLEPVARPLYRSLCQFQYRVAGETYNVEVEDAQAEFFIPTLNEWTDFRSIQEQSILNHLLSNLHRDDVFYDIGANIGLYSCLVADKVTEPVIAFEPHPANADRLEDNIELNSADVSVFQHALADSEGDAELEVTLDKIGSAGHSLVFDSGDNLNLISVVKKRGDDLITEENLPHPTVLKIDVEGAELAVLDGLESTLSRPSCRLVYCETHANRLASQGSSVAAVRDKLESNGFRVSKHTVRRGKGEAFLVGKKSKSPNRTE